MPAPTRLSISTAALIALLLCVTPAFAVTEKVIYSFCPVVGCPDGYEPYGENLVFDSAGNIYGAAAYGGQYNNGVVFELSPGGNGTWTYNILHNFGQLGDGANPLSGVIFDSKGNLYGTAEEGGPNGGGIVYELSPAGGGTWNEQILYGFSGPDGEFPYAGVIFDAKGNLYGTTYGGGTSGDGCTGYGCGVAFELSPGSGGTWAETVLHNFDENGKDGWFPAAPLVFDPSGNLYGTAVHGGPHGYGIAFQLVSGGNGTWTEKILVSFNGTTDGGNPYSAPIFDAAGNAYGSTYGDTVYEGIHKADGKWTGKILTNFSSLGGIGPYAGVTLDSSHNLYGTTVLSIGGDGEVYELAYEGTGKYQGTVASTTSITTPTVGCTMDRSRSAE